MCIRDRTCARCRSPAAAGDRHRAQVHRQRHGQRPRRSRRRQIRAAAESKRSSDCSSCDGRHQQHLSSTISRRNHINIGHISCLTGRLRRVNFAEQLTQTDGDAAHSLHKFGISSELRHIASHRIDLGGELGSISDRLLCLLYTSPSPRDATLSRMPSSA